MRVGFVAAALCLAVVGCSGTSTPRSSPTPSQSSVQPSVQSSVQPSAQSSTQSSAAPTESVTPSPSPSEPAYTQPLVIVTHTTRPPLDIPEEVARRLVAGRVNSWTELGDGPGRLREVDTVRAVVGDRSSVAAVPAAQAGPQVRAVHVDGVDPLREPGRYPLRVPAERAPGPVVRMSVVGDIMLGRRVGDIAAAAGDPVIQLRPMQRRLAAADITVANLENTLSRAGAPTQGDDSFAADPRVARGLKRVGFDVLSLANNHLGDFGDRALVQTVRRLRAAGLGTFGAGATPRAARRPVVLERADVRFGFVGFNAIGETREVAPGQPGAVSVSMPPRTGPLDRAELDRFLDDVRLLDQNVDVVVAMPHWGTQYTNVPEPIQRRVARRLVTAGADLVVGGHPHWVQGSAMVGDRLVVHSLGNFVFDMDFMEQTQKGLLLELTYWGSELKAADFVPYEMDEDFAPRVVSWGRGLETLRLMWETSG